MSDESQFDLFLLDGRHLLWRAASAFPDLNTEVNGERVFTGAMYGFLRLALGCWMKWGGITTVAWDRFEGPTERRKLYPEYKNRPQPVKKTVTEDKPVKHDYEKAGGPRTATVDRQLQLESMREQEIKLKVLLSALGIRQASSPGWEADDVIATLCTRFEGHRVGVLSGDRDLLQLVTDNVTLVRPLPKGQFAHETPASVMEDWGVTPRQIHDLKALGGDAGDNIPGCKGIGPKTAAKLVQEHGGWDQAVKWAYNNVPKAAWHKALVEHSSLVRISAILADLNRSAPLEFIPEQRDVRKAYIMMTELGFNSLMAEGRREKLMAMGG